MNDLHVQIGKPVAIGAPSGFAESPTVSWLSISDNALYSSVSVQVVYVIGVVHLVAVVRIIDAQCRPGRRGGNND